MTLIEVFITLLLFAAMTATGTLLFDQVVKPARLSMAAAEISATMRYCGLTAIERGQTVTIHFSEDHYEIGSGEAATASGPKSAAHLTRRLPAGVRIIEARFGTGSSAEPVLKFTSSGISTPGHVTLSSTAPESAKKRCTVTRALRGQTHSSCEVGKLR